MSTCRLGPVWLAAWLLLASSAAPGAEPPPAAPAGVYERDVSLDDYRVSEKLDSVSGYWAGQRLFTRGGHAVNPPDWFTAGWPNVRLDGQLWLGPGRFAETSGIARPGYRPE